MDVQWIGSARNNFRIIMFLLAALPLVLFGIVVRDFPLLNNTIFKEMLGGTTDPVTFIAGVKGGVYEKIAQGLVSQGENGLGEFKVVKKETHGSLENLALVSRLPKSFTIVQAESLSQIKLEFGQASGDNIQLVTPLYLELMHLVMRKDQVDRYKEKMEKAGLSIESVINQQDFLQKILSESIVSTGPFLGGTNSFAAAILNAANISPQQNLYNISLEEGLRRLNQQKEGKIDALFFMSGAPVPAIHKIFKNKNEGETLTLVPVTGSFPHALQQDFGVPTIRSIIPKGTYPNINKDLPTVGVPAWLVASKDVSTKTILNFLRRMNKLVDEDSSFKEPLDFKDNIRSAIIRYESIKEAESGGFFSRLTVFFFTVIVTWFVFCSLIMTVWSKVNQSIFFKNIHQIYLDYTADTTVDYQENSPKFKKSHLLDLLHLPFTEIDGKKAVNDRITGISNLHKLVVEIREAYKKGNLLISDMQFLLDRLYKVRDIFHRQITQHVFLLFHEYRKDPEKFGELIKLIDDHYMAGYIKKDDYAWLTEKAVEVNNPLHAPSRCRSC